MLFSTRDGADAVVGRANRAQFSEVALRTFNEEDMDVVALPTVQGLTGDACAFFWHSCSLSS